jgi:hypothetical protein
MYNFRTTILSLGAFATITMALPGWAFAAETAPLATVSTASATATASDIPGLSGDYQLRYEAQWNAGGFMQRLLTLLTSPEWGGSVAELKPVIDALQQSGKLNFAGCQEALTIDQNLVHYTAATHYAGLTPDQFKGKLFALPNRPLQSARYVTDDALLYVGLNNVPQTALLAFHELASHPELLAQGPLAEILGEAMEELGAGDFKLEDLPQIEAMVNGLGVQKQVDQLLTGEVGIAFYGADWAKLMQGNEPAPSDFQVAIFLGLKDGGSATQMITAYGSDIGLTPGGTQDGWTSYSLKEHAGVSFRIGPDMLIASVGGAGEKASGQPGLATPECQYYVKLNLDRLAHEVLEPMVGPEIAKEFDLDELAGQAAARGTFTPQQLDVAWRYLLDIDRAGSNLGSVVMTGRYADGHQCDLSMRPDVFMYTLYNAGRIAGAGMLRDHLREQDDDDYSETDEAEDGMDDNEGVESGDEAGETDQPMM